MNSELLILNRILKEMIKGKKIVPYKRQGKIFLRRHRKAKNPRTRNQTRHRKEFKKAVDEWKKLTDEEKEKYSQLAEKMSMSGFNLFVSRHLRKEN